MSRGEQQRIEELARLLDGEVTDRASSEAQKLLVLASAVRDNAPELARPTPAFRSQLRAQLVEEVAASQVSVLDRVRDAVWERTARWRHSAKVATASATASLMIGTVGAAAAAQSAIPGELLYPLKQATESLRLTLSGSTEQTGRVHLALAEERMEEIREGADELTATQLIDALARMDEHTERGAEALLAVFDQEPSQALLDELRAFTARQRSQLTAVVDELPLEAVPFADRSLELLRRIDVQADISAAACQCGLNAAVDQATRAATGTDRGSTGTLGGSASTGGDGGVQAPAAGDTTILDGTGAGTDGTAPSDEGWSPTGPDGLGSDESVEDTAEETVGEVASELDGPATAVSDGATPVTEPVETVTDPVTDTVEETVDDLGGAVDEITQPVQDTVDEVGDLLP